MKENFNGLEKNYKKFILNNLKSMLKDFLFQIFLFVINDAVSLSYFDCVAR